LKLLIEDAFLVPGNDEEICSIHISRKRGFGKISRKRGFGKVFVGMGGRRIQVRVPVGSLKVRVGQLEGFGGAGGR
jgi:hypothetical protein